MSLSIAEPPAGLALLFRDLACRHGVAMATKRHDCLLQEVSHE